MMIWCHLHRELSCKHGITNYEMKEYEGDYEWLMRVSQARFCWLGRAVDSLLNCACVSARRCDERL
jgi:hypothetical protein